MDPTGINMMSEFASRFKVHGLVVRCPR